MLVPLPSALPSSQPEPDTKLAKGASYDEGKAAEGLASDVTAKLAVPSYGTLTTDALFLGHLGIGVGLPRA